MDETSITAAGAIDTFLVLLIGIGPKLALVPFLEITASLDPAAKGRVQRTMLTTAATVAVLLMVLGELLRTLLHFTIGSLSIAGGVILLVLAVWMVLGPPADNSRDGGHGDEHADQPDLAARHGSFQFSALRSLTRSPGLGSDRRRKNSQRRLRSIFSTQRMSRPPVRRANPR